MTTAKSPNIYQRLNTIQKAVTYVEKEKKSGMKYSIVTHDAVTAKVRPLMVEHGVLYYPFMMTTTQSGNRTECLMIVRFQNIEDPMDHMDVHTFGYGIDQQDKGPGKAMSYAVKYALLKALGLETGDDPDKDQDTSHEPDENSQEGQDALAYRQALAEATTDEHVLSVANEYRDRITALAKTWPALAASLRSDTSVALERVRKGKNK